MLTERSAIRTSSGIPLRAMTASEKASSASMPSP